MSHSTVFGSRLPVFLLVTAAVLWSERCGAAEWPLDLRPECVRVLGDARLRHAAQVTAIVPMSDGRRVLSTAQDNTMRLWDMETGEELRRFVHQDDVWTVVLCPGEKTCISSGNKNDLTEWDLSTGRELRRFAGHENTVFRCAVSPDGSRMVSGDSGPDALEWELAGMGKVLRKHTLGKKGEAVYGTAWSPDGRHFALGGEQKQVWLFDAGTGQSLHKLDGHTKQIYTLQFSPDGGLLVSTSEDKTVRCWDVATGRETWKAEFPEDAKIASFSPDGKRVAVGVDDATLRVLDAADGKEQLKIEAADSNIWPVAFMPGGRQILSGGACLIRRHDATTGARLFPPPAYDGPCTPLSCILPPVPDGPLVVASTGDKALFALDPETGRVVARWPNEHRASRFCRSADGRRVFGWGRERLVGWDAATGAELWNKAYDGYPKALACSHDGEEFVVMDSRQHLILRGGSGDEVRKVTPGEDPEHREYISHVVVCPEGRIAACCTDSGAVVLTRLPDMSEVGRLGLPWKTPKPQPDDNAPKESQPQRVRIEAGAILPASGVLVLADDEHAVRQWRPVAEERARLTADQIRRTIGELKDEAFAARQAAIDKLSACGEDLVPFLDEIKTEGDQELGQTIRFLRQALATHRLPTRSMAQVLKFENDLHAMRGHPDGVHWAALEGHGPTHLVFGRATADGLVLVARTEDLNQPKDLVFSPDGRFLYTANGNDTISVYGLRPAETNP